MNERCSALPCDTTDVVWMPIGSAPTDGSAILVCDSRMGRPYTVARVRFSEGLWVYDGADEEVDFEPGWWIDRKVDANPFKIPLGSRAALATGGRA